MRISVTEARVEAIRYLQDPDWRSSRTHAGAQAVLMAVKLWNLTYEVEAGRYLVWQSLRLTDLRKIANS